jgi:proteic killer suppression protein
VIKSYRDKEVRKIAEGRLSKRLPQSIQRRAKMRLDRIAAATEVDDLRLPPSHGLERLSGDRAGQYSIRINDQWRICFVWRDGNAFDVEIVDYH